MAQKTNQKLNMTDDEIFEHINNMPLKYVLFKMMGILWEMLEEQFKGNRKVDKNTPGGMFHQKEIFEQWGHYITPSWS